MSPLAPIAAGPHRKDMTQPQRPIPAVLAVVTRDGQILLVRRANPPDAGLWGFPGGKIEFGEPLLRAAERELAEETGVTATATTVLDALDAYDPPQASDPTEEGSAPDARIAGRPAAYRPKADGPAPDREAMPCAAPVRPQATVLRQHFVLIAVLCRWQHGEPLAGDDALEARWVSPEELSSLPLSRDVARTALRALGECAD